MKQFLFAITIALVLAGSASAQSQLGPPSLWGGTLTVGKIQGVEVTPGTKDFEDQICWGQTFSMMDDTYSLTIAPDYYLNPGSIPWENLAKVTGGSWTLIVRAGKPNGVRVVQNGMLYGTVTGGLIEWSFNKAGNPVSGVLELQVNISGGTGTFANAGGSQTSGTFRGMVEYNGGAPIVTGAMDLMF
jgi:hypothetical protein